MAGEQAGEQDPSKKPENKPNPAIEGTDRPSLQGREKKEGGGNAGGGFNFEAWMKEQSEEAQEGLKTYESGLKTALTKERDNRGDLEKELREAAKKAEAGSEAQKRLTEMADKLADKEREADFYRDAPGKGVVSLELAFIAAESAGLFDSRGRMNWDALKERYPELFAKPGGGGNPRPGAGARDEGGGKDDMNARIRRAAGYQ